MPVPSSACRDLAAVQAAWSKVLRHDLPRMNAVLKPLVSGVVPR